MKVLKWFVSDVIACGIVRGELIARSINALYPNWHCDLKNMILMSDFQRANVMLFQRQHTRDNFDRMIYAKSRGIKTIFEIDDDLLNTPKEFEKPYEFYSQTEVQDQIKAYMQHADAIITSTYPLACSIAPYCDKVPKFVVPNGIDTGTWEVGLNTKIYRGPGNETVTIGWMASGSHAYDANLVSMALGRVMSDNPNVNIHMIGWVGFDQFPWAKQFKDRVKIDSWILYDDLPKNMANWDIGIAPLIDNPFNVSKSDVKVLQYWAAGIVPVVTPLAPYAKTIDDRQNGMFANSEQEWYDRLTELVRNPALRRNMMVRGVNDAKSRSMDKMAAHWVDVFDRILR